MGSLVLNDPEVTFDIVTAGTPAGSPVDVSCHVARIEIAHTPSERSVPTFCDPTGVEAGPDRFDATIDWKLQKTPTATHTALSSYVGETVRVSMVAASGDSEALEFDMAFGNVNPGNLGNWNAGEIVEVTTSHKIDDEPAWA